VSAAPRPSPQQARTTENPWHPRDRTRHLLRLEERLPLEPTVHELFALGNRLLIVREMAHGGTFERLNAALRERLRARLGRNPLPSVGIADSQEGLHVRALAVSPPQLDAVGAVDVLAVLGVQQRRPVEVAGV
jgi:hypothetical protein